MSGHDNDDIPFFFNKYIYIYIAYNRMVGKIRSFDIYIYIMKKYKKLNSNTINAQKKKHNESSSCVFNPKKEYVLPDVEALKIFGDWSALV